MVYPDLRCWDNEGDIDSDGFNTNTGFLPTAIKAMIDRVTGGAETNEEERESGETTEEEGKSEEDEGSDQGDSSRPPRPIEGGRLRPSRPARDPRPDRPTKQDL